MVAGAAVVLVLALFAAVFPGDAVGAFRVWVDSRTFNHCFLILPLTLFMIWNRRSTIASAEIVPDPRAAVGVLVLSAAWLIVSFVGILEVEQFIVMTMVQTALYSIFGSAFYRKLTAPLLYLYFLVPSGEFLIPLLQAFTARFAVVGLHLLGIPVFSNGAVIEIPAGTFVVAEACAGLRFLVAAVAFGVFFAVITYRSRVRRLLFVILSIIVPIVANGLRALGLIAAAEWIGNPAAALADHILYGWIFFSLVLLLLIWIGQWFSDLPSSEPPVSAGQVRPAGTGAASLRRVFVAGMLCIVAAATAPVAAVLLDASRSLPIPQRAPAVRGDWKKAETQSDWRPMLVGAARSFSDSFVDGSSSVDRFVAVYGTSSRNSSLIRSRNRDADEKAWNFDSAHAGVLFAHGGRIPARVSTWVKGTRRRIVWSFYAIDGRAVTGVWTAELDQLMAYLTSGRCVSAYVAISLEGVDERSGTRTISEFLEASEPLRHYLCGSRA